MIWPVRRHLVGYPRSRGDHRRRTRRNVITLTNGDILRLRRRPPGIIDRGSLSHWRIFNLRDGLAYSRCRAAAEEHNANRDT